MQNSFIFLFDWARKKWADYFVFWEEKNKQEVQIDVKHVAHFRMEGKKNIWAGIVLGSHKMKGDAHIMHKVNRLLLLV